MRVTLSILHILDYRLVCLEAGDNGHRSVSSLFNRSVMKLLHLFCVQSSKLSCPTNLPKLHSQGQPHLGSLDRNASNFQLCCCEETARFSLWPDADPQRRLDQTSDAAIEARRSEKREARRSIEQEVIQLDTEPPHTIAVYPLFDRIAIATCLILGGDGDDARRPASASRKLFLAWSQKMNPIRGYCSSSKKSYSRIRIPTR